jgi:hypothetical protein
MYGPETLLLASKKPRIKELVERSRTMTADEIKMLPEKPDIIRGLLLINQFSDQQQKATLAEKIAGAMQKNHVDQTKGDELPCHVFRITAIGENWLKTGSTMLEIKEGWHWAQLENGTVYLANAPITSDDESVRYLMSISQYIGQKTLGEFKDLERQRRNALDPSFILQPS